MSDPSSRPDSEVLTRTRSRTTKPRLYKVLLHNDDFTTTHFVVMILETVFHKSQPEAEAIMLAVHRQGIGLAGVYSREVAESKAAKVHALAEANGFPLRCSVEPE